jgi:aryl-alcohol dehydrogenase-like predicted oxidoreductase
MPVLGSSDIDVFPLTLGANPFGWTTSTEVSHQILDAFVAGGGNFIDTADVYSVWAPGNSGGESESVIGDWLSRHPRESVVIGTKVSQHPQFRGLKAANIAAAADASLERLQTDYIDVYYAHQDDHDTPFEESIGAFAELVKSGKVRAIGLSNYSPERVEEWLNLATSSGAPLPVVLQPHYNLLVRKAFEGGLRPVAERFGLSVSPYFGLASGFLTGKYHSAEDASGAARGGMVGNYLTDAGFAAVTELESVAGELGVEPGTVALAWLRAQPSITAPIASASNPGQVAGLLASATLELSADQKARLARVSDAFGG